MLHVLYDLHIGIVYKGLHVTAMEVSIQSVAVFTETFMRIGAAFTATFTSKCVPRH